MNDLSRASKTLLIVIVVVGSLNILHRWPNKEQEGVVAGQTPEIVADIGQNTAEATFDDLLDAIEWVESKGDANAVGDNGNAVGSFQIWKIYVDDVNRLLGKNIFGYLDRLDSHLSREMCLVYITHYEQNSKKLYPYSFFHRELNKSEWKWGKQTPFERMARIHNGGPNGYKKKSTKPYWEKVKRAIEGE